MKKRMYLVSDNDELELPVFLAMSMKELVRFLGISDYTFWKLQDIGENAKICNKYKIFILKENEV